MVKGVILPPHATTLVPVYYNRALLAHISNHSLAVTPDTSPSQHQLPYATFEPHFAPTPTNEDEPTSANTQYLYFLPITNNTDTVRRLPSNYQMGAVRLVDKQPSSVSAVKEHSDADEPTPPATESAPSYDINRDISPEQTQAVNDMLERNKDIFAPRTVEGPPKARDVTFSIHTNDALPIKQAPYRQSPEKEAYIEAEVQNLLNKGLIVPSFSPWGSPVLVVNKKDHTYRMCIDYRRLNSTTRKDAYPLPRIEDCLDLLRTADWMTIIDLRDAYHHIPMDPDSESKTAFVTKSGLYQWKVMPFGATGAPGAFQRYVDKVLKELNGKICTAYFDDIVVYTTGTLEQHLKDVETVFAKLRNAHLTAKVSKCHFAMTEINFVGHVVSKGTIKPDPEKLKAIQDYPEPKDVTQLKSFLGLSNYYRRFINGFSKISIPLYALTKKGVDYNWTAIQQDAFDQLKKKLTEAPCLYPPDFSKPFVLQTDASDKGIGGVLTQEFPDGEHPIGYVSRQYLPAETRYSPTEQEALAVVYTIGQFEHYLVDRHFTVVTDHSAHVWLPTKKSQNKRLARWAIMLSQFNYSVQYRKGKDNANADALSRAPLPTTPSDRSIDEEEKEYPAVSSTPIKSEKSARISSTTIELGYASKNDTQLTTVKTFYPLSTTSTPLYIRSHYETLFALHPTRVSAALQTPEVQQHKTRADLQTPRPELIPIRKWQDQYSKAAESIATQKKVRFNLKTSATTRNQKEQEERKEKEKEKEKRETNPEKQIEIAEKINREQEQKEEKQQQKQVEAQQAQEQRLTQEVFTEYYDFTVLDLHHRNQLAQAQLNDPFCKPIIQFLYKHEIPADLNPVESSRFRSLCENYIYRSSVDFPEDTGLFYLSLSAPLHGVTPIIPRLVIPRVYQLPLIQVFHDSPFAGHLGINKTYKRISERFYWKGMYLDTMNYILSCPTCKESKIINKPPAQPSTRLPRPIAPMEIVAMDHIGPLTRSNDFEYILLIICLFTRWVIAIPVQRLTSSTTARVLVNELICKHGTPKMIISDNAANFRSEDMTDFYSTLGIKHFIAPSYHPQSNGMAERAVGSVKKVLRSYFNQHANQWLPFLQPAVFAINSAPSASTGISPFFMLYGRQPRMAYSAFDSEPVDHETQMPETAYATFLYNQLYNTHNEVRILADEKFLAEAQENMQSTTFHTYSPGDSVYLKTDKATKTDSERRNSKQPKRDSFLRPYTGPFRVIKRVGQVMYLIEPANPSTTSSRKRQELVHVSRLKADRSNDEPLPTPQLDKDSTIAPTPANHSEDTPMDLSDDNPQPSSASPAPEPQNNIAGRLVRNRWKPQSLNEESLNPEHEESTSWYDKPLRTA